MTIYKTNPDWPFAKSCLKQNFKNMIHNDYNDLSKRKKRNPCCLLDRVVCCSSWKKDSQYEIREGVQKNRFSLGKSPKLLVGGGQES